MVGCCRHVRGTHSGRLPRRDGARERRMTDSRERSTIRARYAGLLLATIIVPATLCHASLGRAEDSWFSQGWAMSLFGGPVTHTRSSKIFLHGDADFDSGGALVLALSKGLLALGDGFSLEAEGQVAQHVARTPHHQELNLVLGLRFSDFPWIDELPTSFAIFAGPSYATSPPKFEPQEKTQWLNYLGAELAVAAHLRRSGRRSCAIIIVRAPLASIPERGMNLRCSVWAASIVSPFSEICAKVDQPQAYPARWPYLTAQ